LGTPKFITGHVIPKFLFRGWFVIIGWELLQITYVQNLNLLIFICYSSTKCDSKCIKYGDLGVYRVNKSSWQHNQLIECIHIHTYSALTETMHLSCTISELYEVLCRKWPILTNLALKPQFGDDPVGSLSESPWANAAFSRFETISACDEQTYILDHGIYRASIASRGKNLTRLSQWTSFRSQ